MLEHALRQEVGAVGAKLIYPNNTIQHAGVIIGLNGIANHAFCFNPADDHGYFGQANVIKNCSAVTGACLMIRKELYRELGGLDENNLKVAFNDIDLCLRLGEKGYSIVYTPYAKLYHHESLSRGREVSLQEIDYMQKKYSNIINGGDPFYNPNLTRERLDYSLRVADSVQ
jgi:GT2 family glycosyltransferase